MPTLVSLTPSTTLTDASSVTYTAVFSEAVTGVDAADFVLDPSGTDTAASITSVAPVADSNGTTYTVTVATGGAGNDGTIVLDLIGTTIEDLAGNAYYNNNVFEPATTDAVGSYPFSVAVGDLTGNGIQDIVTANEGNNDVSVLLGNGDGTFQPAQTYSVGADPYAVAIGNLTSNGIPDIVTANVGGGISVLLGNGDGTFKSAQTYVSGQPFEAVAIGNFFVSGLPDIVAVNFDSVSLLLNQGNGTFTPFSGLPGELFPTYIGTNPGVAIIDNQGASIVVAGDDNVFVASVNELLEYYDDWQTYAVGNGSGDDNAVAVGDLTGNGISDIVTANEFDNDVSVLLGNSNGTFQSQVTYAVGDDPTAVALADLTGNGILDIITENEVDGTVSVLYGNGDGTFQPQVTYAAGSYDYSVAIADLNGDGRPDIITANPFDNDVSVLLNEPQTVSAPTVTNADTAPCYCPGTMIATPSGERPVETLSIGDLVTTMAGVSRPITWIGRRSYGSRFVMGRKDTLPICIKAGALADNVPKRDLWISPHHAMYLEGVLIEAKDLLNGASIVQADRVDKIEYFHIELDTHDVIIAEGAYSESFIDDDSRGMFHNAHEYRMLYPDAAPGLAQYCAPRLEDGYVVEAARRRIALRAGLPSADQPQIGVLRGFVDRVGTDRIAGWAQNIEHPEAPVCLEIRAGEHVIGQVLANQYRKDLQLKGLGSGRHGFAFTPPAGLAFSLDAVEVRRALDHSVLRLTARAKQEIAANSAGASSPLSTAA
jgi:hypothetical protein